MCSHSWNKLIAASSALAAAGVLTCGAASFDVFLPKGTLTAFLASMALLGLLVSGVVIGFTWACDRYESHAQERLIDSIRPLEAPGRNTDYSIVSRRISSGRHSYPTWNAKVTHSLHS